MLFSSAWFPVWAIGVGFLLAMAALVLRGIQESMWVNVAFTLVEAAGLLLVIAVSIPYWGSVDLLEVPDLPGGDATVLLVMQGAVLTFFAFIGFEDTLNVAEECRDPQRTIPIALVTAMGGGTLRDLLLGLPPFWIQDPRYVEIVLLAAVLTVLYARFRPVPERALLVADALGLALFSIAGAQIAERAGVDSIVVIALGTVTGVAGGMLRDVLVNDVPMILRKGQIYATAAIIGIALYQLLQLGGVSRHEAALAGMAAVAVLRLAAIVWNLSLPVFRYPER